ncbi:MAG: formylglycine-generating enzyme family protein [Leptospirales bacterium]|nr:formylglycine-generating enzyme family protein [Leptospirales bacterium]
MKPAAAKNRSQSVAGAALFGLLASLSLLLSCGILRNGAPDCDDIAIPEDMRCIPAGAFTRGSDRQSRDEDTQKPIHDEAPVARIEMSAYLMDVREVAYPEYQQCVQAGVCSYAHPNYRHYDGPRQPMVGLTWFQARDYCRWRGKRLPSEAEWEKAARGPDGELYPWGNEPATCQRAIIQESGEKGCGTGRTWDVQSRPVYRYGLYDMAGNSWEWVNDWYSHSYAECGAACLGRDPRGPCNGADVCPGYSEKIVRGGSWWWDGEYAAGSNRRPHFPANHPFHHFGFRCARDLNLPNQGS